MNVREDALEAFYEGTKHTVDPSPPHRATFGCPFCSSVLRYRLNFTTMSMQNTALSGH